MGIEDALGQKEGNYPNETLRLTQGENLGLYHLLTPNSTVEALKLRQESQLKVIDSQIQPALKSLTSLLNSRQLIIHSYLSSHLEKPLRTSTNRL